MMMAANSSGHCGIEYAWRNRLGLGQIERKRRQRQIVGDPERPVQRECFAQGHAHRIDVASDLVGAKSQQSFRGHVERCAGAVAHLVGSRDIQIATQPEIAQVHTFRPADYRAAYLPA